MYKYKKNLPETGEASPQREKKNRKLEKVKVRRRFCLSLHNEEEQAKKGAMNRYNI